MCALSPSLSNVELGEGVQFFFFLMSTPLLEQTPCLVCTDPIMALVVVGRGRLLHEPHCPVCRRRQAFTRPASETEVATFARCAVCSPPSAVCLVCGTVVSEDAVACPCAAGHVLCAECHDGYVRRACSALRPISGGRVGCPCGCGAEMDPRTWSKELHGVWQEALLTCDATRHAPWSMPRVVAELVDDVFTLRCPECDAAFDSYDACAAVQCTCGAWFCAFCMTPAYDARECHTHVRNCHLNPRRGLDYFVSTEEWSAVQRARAANRLRERFAEVRACTSLVHALALFSAISGHFDHLKRELWSGTRVQAVADALSRIGDWISG